SSFGDGFQIVNSPNPIYPFGAASSNLRVVSWRRWEGHSRRSSTPPGAAPHNRAFADKRGLYTPPLPAPVSVLLVEDDSADTELTQIALANCRTASFKVSCAPTIGAALG